MLKIRLQRVGRIHEPIFRFVLTESQNSTKSGKYLEVLGNYDARHGEKAVFDSERITYWMSKGAQVTPTVHNILVDKKVLSGKKVNKLPLKKAIVKDMPAQEATPAQVSTDTTEASSAEPAVEEAAA